jgi:two-component system cell cycle response regulator
MPDTDLQRAQQIGERLRAGVAAEPFRINAQTELWVTASVGLATLERSDDSPGVLLKRADQALYAAKRDGRNRVVTQAA